MRSNTPAGIFSFTRIDTHATMINTMNIKYSTEGMTKHGLASSRMIGAGYAKEFVKHGGRYLKADRPRLMPETIYSICARTGKDPRQMLYDYGWIL